MPGHARALAEGRLPRVPRTPPALLPGRTASSAARRLLVRAAVAVAGALAGPEAAGRAGVPAPVSSVAVLVLGLAGLALLLRGWAAVGDRNLEELRHGYTTLVLSHGSFRGGVRRDVGELGPPWDYAGIWVLAGDGRVRQPPDLAVDPPGFYPSPLRPGEDELWTGAAWTGQLRPRRPPGPRRS